MEYPADVGIYGTAGSLLSLVECGKFGEFVVMKELLKESGF